MKPFTVTKEDVEKIRAAERTFVEAALAGEQNEESYRSLYSDFHHFMMENYFSESLSDGDNQEGFWFATKRAILRHQWANISNFLFDCLVAQGKFGMALNMVCRTSKLFEVWRGFSPEASTTAAEAMSRAIALYADGGRVKVTGMEVVEGQEFQNIGSMVDAFTVVSELLANAVKYSPAGTKISVEFSCKKVKVKHLYGDEDEQHYFVAVRDHGFGIPESEQELVLQEGYRSGRTADEIVGSGFGLSYVYLASRKNLTIKSPLYPDEPVQKGTEIRVKLPLW